MSKRTSLDPRVERTRAALVEAFQALSMKRRLTSISVTDVAAKARVNRATFYAHFTDKTALLNYTVRARLRDQLRQQVPTGSTLTPPTIERLIVAVCNVLALVGPQCRQLHGSVEGLIESTMKAEMRAVMLELLESGGRAGATAGDGVGRPMRATIATWAIYGAALDWRTTRDTRSSEVFAAAVAPTIARVLDM
jgi:AcrR family transcriptional regulator